MLFLYLLVGALAAVVAAPIVILRLPRFGKLPSGDRLARVERSPNYQDGQFTNQSPTPMFTGEGNMATMSVKFLTQPQPKRRTPEAPLPHVKTSLKGLDPREDVLVWFGHSSYFLQVDGRRVLVDPVLSGHASPFPFAMKAFPGSDHYKAEMMPDIDLLIITHDHGDHLDHKTMMALKDRIGAIVCPLGVGAHFEHWGFAPEKITELDWWESANVSFSDSTNAGASRDASWTIHAAPARHFSGRALTRNRSLWASYALFTSSLKIYIGGDSGYDAHFIDIGNKYGPFDLAILELGQYNDNWKYIHMQPQFFLQAARDLKATRVMPVHNSKFALAQHEWSDPLKSLSESGEERAESVITPRIGEVVRLRDTEQVFEKWWTDQR